MKEKSRKEEMIDREMEILFPVTTDNQVIDVESAWNKVRSGINIETPVVPMIPAGHVFPGSSFMKIAAAVLILLGLGTAALFTLNSDSFSKTIIASTGDNDKNQKVLLSDGSTVTLNHNTELAYKSSFGKQKRKVSLSGEAFFEIAADASKPFIIDAGKASIKVVGTSFNVITENADSAVEVFVATGKVLLSDNNGNRDMILEPGYIGTMDYNNSGKTLNQNPNYMSWKEGKLDYDGQPLEIVFRDLKRVYNMEIKADDPSILTNPWTAPIISQSSDTIIRIICASFNLSYTKDGNVYHLSKK
jgi:ferric-dicitrate binding protein FerR (iron transport regulator)